VLHNMFGMVRHGLRGGKGTDINGHQRDLYPNYLRLYEGQNAQ